MNLRLESPCHARQMLDLAPRNLLYIRELPQLTPMEVAVNRTELVDSVSGKTGLDKKQSEAAVSAVADAVMAEIKAGNKVSLFGFGTFSPTARAARMGRNPQTGAPVKIAASKGVRFAPASAFKGSAQQPRWLQSRSWQEGDHQDRGS